MLFSSNIFLFSFLPFTLLFCFLLPQRFRNFFLLFVSLIFYAWGEPKFVLIMIASILMNYLFALAIDHYRGRQGPRKFLLVLSVVCNLSLLFVFKYLDFAIVNLDRLGFSIPLQHIALPIGISFFTFQAMSYVIDVYRGTSVVQKKFHNLGLFVAFFPQLIAGPIVRYNTIERQIQSRTVTLDGFSYGVQRFIWGFSKKILLANNMAVIADYTFSMAHADRSVLLSWLGAFAYAFQIYFDFSGYSDMAIGLGRMFGFSFLENFNYPYISKSISEFWRRWHISLGQWFRDYVYFPLGGSRVSSKALLIRNLFIVWFLTGLWHGASWNFLLWGLMYFVLIAFEKLTGIPERIKRKGLRVGYQVFILLCVLMGWVLFRSVGLGYAIDYGKSMFGLAGNPLADDSFVFYFKEYAFFLLAAFLFSTPFLGVLKGRFSGSARMHSLGGFLSFAASAFLLLWSVSFLILGAHNPFIYFNF